MYAELLWRKKGLLIRQAHRSTHILLKSYNMDTRFTISQTSIREETKFTIE